jgi:hypothetical protein
MKIFPRNLTARADYVVRGNPANSRPESGVDNCYPGLEFDQRNLEQRFFPGLYFEYYRSDGAVLAAPPTGEVPPGIPVPDSAQAGPPLFLWYLYAADQDAGPQLHDLHGLGGLAVWAIVRDLLPGRVAIVLGPGAASPLTAEAALAELQRAHDASRAEDRGRVVRSGSGEFSYAVLAAERSPYLTDGVIDVGAYAPGELTKTMCAPWIYDFHDCYCYYWASNKPDIVESADGKQRYLDFLRADRESDPPPQDLPKWFERDKAELSQEPMLELWHRLPVVVNDRETIPTPYLTHAQAVGELSYLATVEHALTVQYLYARYSIDAPREQPGSAADDASKAAFAASRQLLAIAIDEMRHFMWANRLLKLLGAAPSTERAREIDSPPEHDSGRKVYKPGLKSYAPVPFTLQPFTPELLGWFVRMEARSRAVNEGIDGMYVELLRSIRDQPPVFPARDTMLPVIKLIIDEGAGHHGRFLELRETLAPVEPARYLRALGPPTTALHEHYLDLCDAYYHTVLDAIDITFTLGDKAGSVIVRDAVRSMRSLDDVAQILAAAGVAPRLSLDARGPTQTLSHAGALEVLDRRAEQHADALDGVIATGAEPDVARAAAHRESSDRLFGALKATVEADAQR